jgi:hypothetical protein
MPTEPKIDKAHQKRIIALALQDGMENEVQLKQNIYMTRQQYYAAVLEGFDQGVAAKVVPVPRYILVAAWSSLIPWGILLYTVLK